MDFSFCFCIRFVTVYFFGRVYEGYAVFFRYVVGRGRGFLIVFVFDILLKLDKW